MSRLTKLPLLRLVFIIAIVVRLVQLSADMPLHISPVADEGIYVHNARNKVLFGEWVLDEWNNMYISPTFNYFVYLSFRLFGVGFVQARLVSVAASLVTVWLVLACLKGRAGPMAAFLGGLLLAVNYIYVFFGKMALMEPSMIMFMTMAMYFFLRGKERGLFFMLCGACCSLAFVTKNFAGFYFIVPYAAVLLGRRARGRVRACGLIMAGQLAVVALWFFTFYLPNRGFIDLHNRIKIEERVPATLGQAAHNVATMLRYPLFGMLPFLGVAALIGLLLVARAILKKRGVESLETYGAVWIVANIVYMSVFSWRPLRYSLSLIIPMVILSVIPVFLSCRARERGETGVEAFLSPRRHLYLKRGITAVLALSILLSGYQLARAWLHPRVMWPALAMEIEERIPPESTISGGPAMGASMGIKNRLVWIHQLADYSKGDPFSRYGIDYLVVESRELEFYKMVFPDVLPRLLEEARLIHRMPLDDRGDALFVELPAREKR